MSDRGSPLLSAFRELETLVHHLGDELATFRKRALTAEGRLKSLEGAGGGDSSGSAGSPEMEARVSELERENAMLRARLETASQRVRQMHERVRFLRQQTQVQGTAGSER